MSEAVAVRRDGDRFQARIFWTYAADMLADASSPIRRIGFEAGPKGFDDVWLEYDPRHAPGDGGHGRILRRHVQCKWHATPDTYTHEQLADADFINATSRSLLQRALAAQRQHAPTGEGSVFQLMTNWQIHKGDPLSRLINTRHGGLRIDELFEGKTTKSAMGRLRDCWQRHLGLDDEQLRVLARTLRFTASTDTLAGITETLNRHLRLAGLKPVPPERSAFPYDEVVFAWLGEGPISFDRGELRDACRREDLLGDREPPAKIFGVKSFEHAVDRIEHRCSKVLDLVPQFSDRFIHDDAAWADQLYPRLKSFLLNAARDSTRIRLALDAHATLAFAAGSVLDTKCGRVVELEQRSPAYQVWSPDDHPIQDGWPGLDISEHAVQPRGHELAVAIGLTHDVRRQVEDFVTTQLPNVRGLLSVLPEGGPGHRVVRCGAHADQLAAQIAQRVRGVAASERTVVHLFLAAPNAFTFMLGQRHALLGRIRLYEYDFEGRRTGTYEASLELPVAKAATNPAG
jgi:hypothetical protein